MVDWQREWLAAGLTGGWRWRAGVISMALNTVADAMVAFRVRAQLRS